MKRKILKLINKKILARILFYGHLTFGFLGLSLISLYFEISHLIIASIWSTIFIVLSVFKFLTENNGDK